MLVNKLQENKDKDAEKSQFIIAEAIVMLKKRIRDRENNNRKFSSVLL